MEKILDFLGNNYAWFLTITLVLLFALIGYIYDSKRNKSDLLKKTEKELEEASFENILVTENDKSLAEVVNTSKNINPETKKVELTDETILADQNNNTLNIN